MRFRMIYRPIVKAMPVIVKVHATACLTALRQRTIETLVEMGHENLTRNVLRARGLWGLCVACWDDIIRLQSIKKQTTRMGIEPALFRPA